jgi:prepilin signal peptidase PulO-like enzyme (type II secretory pathway)
MNAVLDFLNTVLDAVIGALGVALAAVARAALANASTAEWVLAVALAGTAWMLSSGRGWRAVGLLAFSLAVAAGGWLAWRTNHPGMVAQQAVLAAMVLHGLKGRGWSLTGKGAAK